MNNLLGLTFLNFTDSPTSTDKRSHFKKSHSHSVEDGVVDTSNTLGLVNAVSTGHRQSGARNDDPVSVVGEGNLKVLKKGREVIYTTTEVIHQSSKCNHHCPKPEELIIDAEEVKEEKQLTPSSSLEDLVPTPVIKQVDEKYVEPVISPVSPVVPIDNLIQIEVDESESIFAQTEVAKEGFPQIKSPTTERVQTVPVIDQVVSGFDGKVKSLNIVDSSLEKPLTKPKIKPNPLPSPYKSGPSYANSRIPTSVSINRLKSTSTHNLSAVGKDSTPASLGKFSQSTASLNGSTATRRLSKPIISQPIRNTSISANRRAKSISNISMNSNVISRSRQLANASKTDVFERLSANPKRNTTTPRIVNPPVKRRASMKHPENNLENENNNGPTVRRRNSVNTVKKIIYTDATPVAAKAATNTVTTKRESQRTLKPSGSVEIRRSSVARMPAEGTRIPRPAKVLTVSDWRSKSVGPSAYPEGSSVR